MASWFEEIAALKGYNAKEYHIFARCFWLGIAGWLYTIALPYNSKDFKITKIENNEKSSYSGLTWICSQCGKTNPCDTAVCQKCSTINHDMWHKLHD